MQKDLLKQEESLKGQNKLLYEELEGYAKLDESIDKHLLQRNEEFMEEMHRKSEKLRF